MANLSNINNKFLVTTTGEVLIGQTSNNGNRLQITGADGASYIYLKTDVATTGGRIGFNGDALRVFNQQASGELQLGTAGVSRVRIDSSGVTTLTAEGYQLAIKDESSGNISEILTSNTAMGFFADRADAVANTSMIFSIDNDTKMTINSSGQVGIGDNPSFKLDVNVTSNRARFKAATGDANIELSSIAGHDWLIQSKADSSFAIYDEDASAERMRIDSNGNVGINETDPDERLSVIGGNILVKSSNSGGGDANNNLILFDTDTTGSSGQGIGSVQFYGSDSSGAGAGIKCQVKAFYASDGDSSIMTFSTSDSTTNNQERMRIDSSGNLLLGNGVGNPYLALLSAGGNGGNERARIFGYADGGTYGGGLEIQTRDSANIFQNRMRIESDGQVSLRTAGAHLMFQNTAGTAPYIANAGTGYADLTIATGGAERMRITSSGQVNMTKGSSGTVLYLDGVNAYDAETGIQLSAGRAKISGFLNTTGGTPGSSLRFYTMPDNGSVTERMRIASDGTITATNSANNLVLGNAAVGDMYIGGGNSNTQNIIFQAGSERMRITSVGTVGIGDTNPTLATRLVVAGPSGSGNVCDIRTGTTANTNVGAIVFRNSASSYCGQITVNGATAVTSYLSASDYRLKEDLQNFNGLDLVSNIKVYDYKWKSADERTYGVVAHELQEVLPQAVDGNKDDEQMQGVDYSKIVPLLVKSIQELKAEIELLKSK